MKSKRSKKFNRRSKRMLNDDSQAGPLAIQDSQDFLEGDFSSDVVLKPTGSLRLSGYRHRRQKTAPFDETMQRIHMIAGVTSSIYIQGGIFNGTINSKELISEMLRFNPVTPDQINAFDYAKFEGALNQLKELPGKVETGGGIGELETFFGFVHKVVEHIKDVENVEQWPDQEDFKTDLERMHRDGGEIKFATDLAPVIADWISDTRRIDDKTNSNQAKFFFVKDLINASSKILAAGASASIPEVFTFTNKKPPSQSVEFVRKIINAVKLIDANSLRKPGTGFDELTSKVQIVKDTLASLQDIQTHLDQVETFFKSRASSWNLPPIKYTAGLPEGFKDVRQMLNDLEQDWSLAIVKSKYLLESFASIKSLDNKVSEIDMSLGVGAEEIAETVTNIIRTSSHLATTFSSFETKNAKDVVQCHFIPDKVKADELDELITFATEIEDEITNLKNGIKSLKTSLSNKEGQGHLTALVDAFGEPDENDQASLTAAMDKVLTSPSLEGAKTFVNGLVDQAKGISSKNLKDKAKKAFDKISFFEKFVKDHKDTHLKILQCFIEKKETDSSVAVIKEMRKIRPAQQQYVDMVDKGLDGVKKVVGIKDKLIALDKAITDLKGKNPASQKLLNMFVDPEKHSNIVGFSTRGVLSMKRALTSQPSSKYFKPHEKLVETEANTHSKKLTKEQVDILKKYPSISTELDVLLPKLNDFPGKFSNKNMVNLTDFPEIFIQAKDVVGISLDFGQMVQALDVLILQQTSKSSEEQTLKKIRKNLVGLSSMGLDFASYHQYYDKYKDSAKALDLFFMALNKAGSMTTPSPLLQNDQNAMNQNRKNAAVDVPWLSKPEHYGPITGGIVAFVIGGGIAFFFWRRSKKENQEEDDEEDDDQVGDENKDLVFAFYIGSSRRAIQFIKCLFGKWVNFADKVLRLEYPAKELFKLFKKLNVDEEVDKIENERKKAGADLPNRSGPVVRPGPLVEYPPVPDDVASSAPGTKKQDEKKPLTEAEIRNQTFFKWALTLHYAVVSDHKPESYEVWKHPTEHRHGIALSPKNRIVFPTSNPGENPNKEGGKDINKEGGKDTNKKDGKDPNKKDGKDTNKKDGKNTNKKGGKKPKKTPKKSSKKPKSNEDPKKKPTETPKKKSSEEPKKKPNEDPKKKSNENPKEKTNEEPNTKLSTKTFATDYFHGNYVQLNNGWKTYLIQAPLVNTEGRTPNVDKFYFLVKDKGIKAVVMLCDFEETSYLEPEQEPSTKAEKYFPTEMGEELRFGDFTVKCTALSREENVTTRTLQLKYDGETEVYEFTHYHYTGWPDHSAPEDPTEVVKLLMTVRKTEKVLVHCSAGIGRTGSFVYSELIYQEIAELKNEKGEVDLSGRLRWLRTERAESIQEPIQFAFSLVVVVFMLFYEVQDLHPSIAKFLQITLESYKGALKEFKKEGKERYDKKNEAKAETKEKKKQNVQKTT
ncbi:unnamed protein product [Caenorhabditis brenneri]